MASDLSPAVLLAPRIGSPPAPVVPEPTRFTLANGLRVVAVARNDLPQVAARLVVPAGSSYDPSDWPGAASLTATLLTEGTERYSAIELNERVDRLGATLGARAGHDYAEVDLGLLSETLADGLGLFAEIIGRSTFPERELERIRAEALDGFEARLDEPGNVADDRTALAVFGDQHPYGRLPLGTPDGVRKIRRSDIVEFHRSRYRPEGSTFVLAGDFDVGTLRATLDGVFAGWSGKVESAVYPPPPTRPVEAGELALVDWEDGAQGEIRVAGLGMARTSPDWIPAAVANYILGGSTITGRLGANLREDKGWTYGVRSGFAAGTHPAGWSVETAVDAEATEDALAEIEKELARIVSEPVSEEELSRAKEALVLSLPRAFETPGRIVARFATIEAFGLGDDYWRAFPALVAQVTRNDIQRIAATYFAPALLARVAVTPRAGQRIDQAG
jgi:zinc protease